jgi:MFS family permease
MIISSGFLHIQRRYNNDQEGMGVAMSIVTTGIISGVTFGPPLGGLLYGIHTGLPFFLLVGLIVAAALQALALSRALAVATDFDIAIAAGEGETAAEFRTKLKKLLLDKNISVTLLALFCANGAIACLEATFGNYMEDTFGFTVSQIGMLYVIGAVPSVLGSKIAGGLGNKYGRWKVVMAGLIIQGSFYALGPKDVFAVELVSLIMLGLGMGLVDGCAPALLAQKSEMAHGGTGIVYTLNTMAVQCGFIFGPIVGSGIMELHGFAIMSLILGSFMILVSPLMLINKNMPKPGDQKGVRELENSDAAGVGANKL